MTINFCVKGPKVNLVISILIHDALNFAQEHLSVCVTNRTTHVNGNGHFNSFVVLHAWQDCATVLTLAVRTLEGVVVADDALNVHTQDFTPVHLRLSQVLDHTHDACWHFTCACGLCGLDHCFFDLVLDSLDLFFAELGLALAFTFLLVTGLGLFQVLVQCVAKLLQQIFHRDLLCFFVELVVDLFPGHATILWIIADLYLSDLSANSLINKDLINSEVLCDVSQFGIAATFAAKVIKHAVTDLVTKQEL